MLLEESQVEQLTLGADSAAMASWIAVTALSGVPGNNASQAIKNKVRGILAAWRQRRGQVAQDCITRCRRGASKTILNSVNWHEAMCHLASRVKKKP